MSRNIRYSDAIDEPARPQWLDRQPINLSILLAWTGVLAFVVVFWAGVVTGIAWAWRSL